MPLTLTAEVERVTFENEETSFRVLRVRRTDEPRDAPLVVVGTFPAVGPGSSVRVTGELVVDPRFGEQLRADTLVPLGPATLAGLERYLGSGVLPGIGQGLAKRIVDKFGAETLNVLDRDPKRLAEVSGISAKRTDELAAAWTELRGVSSVMLLLQTHGASPALAARIIKRYGDRAAAVVTRSPYRLALEVSGIGFKTADVIAKSLGIAGDHPERAQAGLMHVLGELAEQGHVLSPRELLVERSAEMLAIESPHVEAAIDALWAGERVVVDGERVYLFRLHAAEQAIAAGFARVASGAAKELPGLERAIADFEREQAIALAPRQAEAVRAAAERKLVVITGGPGVGKTTIVRCVLSVFEGAGLRCALAAPTGRAAKRMSEATSHPASTLHRLLEYDPRAGGFARGPEHLLECEALIVDEASMVDVPLAAALLEALPSEARLVVVGDADQLPSVGPGAFLRDVIESGVVPTVRLDFIFRQGQQSRIVENAHRIQRGELPESASQDDPRPDFFVIDRRDPEKAAELVEELVTRRISKRFGHDPLRAVQVLTPMHRGEAGTQALNRRLQASLNPTGAALVHRGSELRVGDRVMQTKNDYEREVFNGDVGLVSAVDAGARSLAVSFDGHMAEYLGDEIDALQLAYATTVHKSQGSEYPAVVLPLMTQHYVMLSRNLLYTAVTRARELCVLIADPRALRLALDAERDPPRHTALAERLRALFS